MEDEKKILEEFQRELDRYMAEVNATPREDMDNLSPNDMQFILYNTFGEGSPLQYRSPLSNETLGKIPFYKLFRKYLTAIKEAGQIKLTAIGNLPRKLCLELYQTGIIREEFIESGIVKLNKETDSIVNQNLKIIGIISRVTKKRNNKLSLTKRGEELLRSEDHYPLFKTIFETNVFRFNLGYHDGYTQNSQVQFVIGFTFYLLLTYGDEKRDIDFYARKNLNAFPQLLEAFGDRWSTPEQQYRNCYYIRVFERLLEFYGFVEIEKTRIPNTYEEKIEIRATDIFRAVFDIKKENFRFRKAGNMA